MYPVFLSRATLNSRLSIRTACNCMFERCLGRKSRLQQGKGPVWRVWLDEKKIRMGFTHRRNTTPIANNTLNRVHIPCGRNHLAKFIQMTACSRYLKGVATDRRLSAALIYFDGRAEF